MFLKKGKSMTIERKGNLVKFLDTDGITYNTWLKLLNRINYLGYDLPHVDFLMEYFNRHTFLNEDQSLEVLRVLGEEQIDDTISEETIKEYNQKAKDYFGTTEKLGLAGYILTDGTLLKMSYDDWIRDRDHREIEEVLDVDTSNDRSAAMVTFINFGNIRVMSRCFEISRPLTIQQKPIIARIVRNARNSDYTYLAVDISNTTGQVVKTFEYDFPSLSDVFNDIDNYFESIKI